MPFHLKAPPLPRCPLAPVWHRDIQRCSQMISIRRERREAPPSPCLGMCQQSVQAAYLSCVFLLQHLCCRVNLMVCSPFGERTTVTAAYAQSANPPDHTHVHARVHTAAMNSLSGGCVLASLAVSRDYGPIRRVFIHRVLYQQRRSGADSRAAQRYLPPRTFKDNAELTGEGRSCAAVVLQHTRHLLIGRHIR